MGERRGCAWPGGYDEGQGKQLRHSRRGVGRERSSPESDEPGAGVAMMITSEVDVGRRGRGALLLPCATLPAAAAAASCAFFVARVFRFVVRFVFEVCASQFRSQFLSLVFFCF